METNENRMSADETRILSDPALAKDREQEYVHQVYEEIASHFSQTRYKVGSAVSVLIWT